MTQLSELISQFLAAEEKATKGPFSLHESDDCTPGGACRSIWTFMFKEKLANCINVNDAEFIALSRNIAPDIIRRLVRNNEVMKEALKIYMGPFRGTFDAKQALDRVDEIENE